MSELEKEIGEKVKVAIKIFNSEKGQELVEQLRQEYLKSTKAKHTKAEWDELKQRLIVDCILNYYLQDQKAKEHLGELVYKELKEKKVVKLCRDDYNFFERFGQELVVYFVGKRPKLEKGDKVSIELYDECFYNGEVDFLYKDEYKMRVWIY